MLLTFEILTYEKDEKILAFKNIISLFIRGLGGFGYKGKYQSVAFKKPTGKPC
jgi:hypothetical protein